jgi:hypothetical protein
VNDSAYYVVIHGDRSVYEKQHKSSGSLDRLPKFCSTSGSYNGKVGSRIYFP